MEKWLWEQLVFSIKVLSQGNLLITLLLIAVYAIAAGFLLAMIIRVIRAVLPFLVIAGFMVLCWQMGLLNQFEQLLGSLR